MNKYDKGKQGLSIFSHPLMGTTMTVLSGLSFLFIAMLLPMVGAAGAAAPHAAHNYRTFAAVVVISLVLSVLAIVSKMARRKMDHSPLPMFSFGLCGLTVLLLVALVAGLLKV